MLFKNTISIFRKPSAPPEIDYYIQFSGNGNISVANLQSRLSASSDFLFEIAVKVDEFPRSGIKYIMNSCYNGEDDKIAIFIDDSHLYVHQVAPDSSVRELIIGFTDISMWHTISVTQVSGSLSAQLDKFDLAGNPQPQASLPLSSGFMIGSDTAGLNALDGSINTILITDTIEHIAQFPLNTGEGTTAYDVVGNYNGTITNGIWRTL